MQLRLDPIRNGAGVALPTRVSIRLVDAAGVPRIALATDTGLPVTEHLAVDILEPTLFELVPTARLAADAAATALFYRVDVAAPHRVETHRIQAPDVDAVFALAELVAATAAPPAQPLWESILTATGEDRLATAEDRAATAADRLAVAADRLAAAADRAQTGADRAATGEDRAATAADRLQTGEDRTQTSLDRAAVEDGAAYVAENLAESLWYLGETDDGVTLGAGLDVLVSDGAEPYDHVVLSVGVP